MLFFEVTSIFTTILLFLLSGTLFFKNREYALLLGPGDRPVIGLSQYQLSGCTRPISHGLTIHHHDSDILLCPSHARIFSNSLSTWLKHDYWIVEECGEDEAKWVDTPIFICDATICSNPLFLHHPIITPAISHCDITILSNVTSPFIPTNTPCDVIIPCNVTYLTQPFIPTNTPCDATIPCNVTYLTQPFIPTCDVTIPSNVTYLIQPFIPTNTPCDATIPCNVTYLTQPFIPINTPCDGTIPCNVTYLTQPFIPTNTPCDATIPCDVTQTFIPPITSYCDSTISSNVSNSTQTPIPPLCFSPNVSNTLDFSPASNISTPIPSLTIYSIIHSIIHTFTTAINHVYIISVSTVFYAPLSPTYATLYGCIDLFHRVSIWMVEKYNAKWATIPTDMWNATIQSNISSLTQPSIPPTPDPSHCNASHHPPIAHPLLLRSTSNVSNPHIDSLCFCPASIPSTISFSSPVVHASTTVINRVYIFTISTLFYALFSPTYDTPYCIDPFPKFWKWMVEKYNKKWVDFPIDMCIQSLIQPPNVTSASHHTSPVHPPPPCIVIFKKEFGIMESLVQWLLDDVLGHIRMTDGVVIVVLIAYFYLMRKREQKLETDLKEKLRREVIGILADKKALRMKITSLEEQLVKEKGLSKKAKSSLLVKLQAYEFKINQMNSDFLRDQELYESVIVDSNNKIMNAEREGEMILKEAKKEAETMLSEAMEKNELKVKTVTRQCKEALSKEMEDGEKRLSCVEQEHGRELLEIKAELSRLRQENRFLRATEEKLFMAERKIQENEDQLAISIGLARCEIDDYKMLIESRRCNSQPSCSALEQQPLNNTSLVSTSSSLQQILDLNSKKLFSYFSSSNSAGGGKWPNL